MARVESRPTDARDKPKITFGADPEFFAINKNGNLVPSWELGITGSKGKPEPIVGYEDAGGNEVGMLCDGVAVEINIAPAERFRTVRSKMQLAVQGLNNSALLAGKAQLQIGKDFIEVQKKYHKHPLFTEIGCTPDLDAYSEYGVRAPFMANTFGSTRFAGGHIHIGCDPWPEYLPKDVFIRFLDIIYAKMNKGFAASPRAAFYGRPGIWRETKYGVEYRSPTTSWLNWPNMVADLAEEAIKSILFPKNERTESSLVEVYNSNSMSQFIEQFNLGLAKNNGLPIVDFYWQAVSRTFDSIQEAVSGKKVVREAVRISLDGYVREYENGQIQSIENPGARERRHGPEEPDFLEAVRRARVAIRPQQAPWNDDLPGWQVGMAMPLEEVLERTPAIGQWYREHNVPTPIGFTVQAIGELEPGEDGRNWEYQLRDIDNRNLLFLVVYETGDGVHTVMEFPPIIEEAPPLPGIGLAAGQAQGQWFVPGVAAGANGPAWVVGDNPNNFFRVAFPENPENGE